jgi:hypothetical protein
MPRAERRLVHDGDVEPPLLFLREAYRGDDSVPAHDDTVTRLFDRYTEALEGATGATPARPKRARAVAALAASVRRRLHR